MYPGILITTFLTTRSKFIANPDVYDAYSGYSVTIPSSHLFNNDFDSDNAIPFILNSIFDIYGGTATINGTNILFNCTVSENIPAGFKYKVKNQKGSEAIGNVTINVIKPPDIISQSDSFNLQQNETLIVSKSSLSSNDIDPLGYYPLTVKSVQDAYGGIVSIVGDNVTFKSIDLTGKPAGFKYTVANSRGKTTIGDVFINITPLPDIDAYIWDNLEQLNNAVNQIKPVSFEIIFNTWPRISGNNYYPDKNSSVSPANAWEFRNGQFYMPLNVEPYCAILSPLQYDNYTLECTLTSINSDNDAIGLVIGYTRINNINYSLVLGRSGRRI